MYAFGMLGSYFSQGVYAVAGPFQGAVDILVVQQEDGSFKSSPWYVKCGDFQGVLKRREKIVDISVNGVPANFYMLLNSRGEAYFEKEVEEAVLALPSASSSAEGFGDNKKLEDLRCSNAVATEEVFQVQCTSTADANGSAQGNSIDQRKGQSDNLVSKTASEVGEPQSTVDQSSDSSVDQSSNNSIDQSSGLQEAEDVEYARRNTASGRDTSCLNAADHLDSLSLTAEDTFELQQPPEVKCMVINVSGENLVLAQADSILPKQLADEERPQLQGPSKVDPDLQTGEDGHLLGVEDEVLNTDTSSPGTDGAVLCEFNTVITEDWFGLQKASSFESGDEATSIRNDLETSDIKTMDELIWNDFKIVTAEAEKELHDALRTTPVIGVRIDGNSLKPDMADERNYELVDSSVWVSDALVNDVASNVAVATTEGSIPMQSKNGDASKEGVTLDKNVICKVEEGSPTEGNKAAEVSTIAVVPQPSRWTMWPLTRRRSRVEKAPVSQAADSKQALLAATNIAVESPLTEEILRKNGYYEWTQKPKLRSYVPTSAQIESLKLKDGPNKVTFTFPRVLGRTQVDANIYLWKWNTRIVISDVDGTITKSDVLGQFMPLVGRDWSQSGVTRLFSAIKENGYEVLFLSARAISQAYLTRQFLINLKQDGETLPEGPVFISPDGLIPSLYREVVRRAPHEFKISCLEGIRRLFPNDVNPFYAGFGNRDTDEISYLKVGIPKGKIFIINPKGEVMVNHHVDAKSYTSIHALVDDMFPPVYSSEQEDFNTWNYWKLPLPDFVDELSATSTKGKKGGTSK